MVRASSGPKDYLKNMIHVAFRDSRAAEIVMVRANGPIFLLLRAGDRWFDASARQVDVVRVDSLAA